MPGASQTHQGEAVSTGAEGPGRYSDETRESLGLDAVPAEAYSCPNCGSTHAPIETTRGDIVYWNCSACDFSTWDRSEFLQRDHGPTQEEFERSVKEATDEEIDRSFDAYR